MDKDTQSNNISELDDDGRNSLLETVGMNNKVPVFKFQAIIEFKDGLWKVTDMTDPWIESELEHFDAGVLDFGNDPNIENFPFDGPVKLDGDGYYLYTGTVNLTFKLNEDFMTHKLLAWERTNLKNFNIDQTPQKWIYNLPIFKYLIKGDDFIEEYKFCDGEIWYAD